MKKFNEFKIKENATVLPRTIQVYDDIEDAINGDTRVKYKLNGKVKESVPINVDGDIIEFENDDKIKDYDIIGTVQENINEGHYREILPQMVKLSNNSQITQQTAIRIAEKFEGVELQDFKRWLQLVETNKNIKKRHF